MDLGLEGVPAAIAGASRGLGYAIALELAHEGAKVAICSRSRGAIQAAATSIEKATGGTAIPVVADFGREGGAAAFIAEAATRLGGLQIAIANAGGPPQSSAADFDRAAWAKALQLNLVSSIEMATAALPHLRRSPWGRILFLTSMAVRQPIARLTLSNAARAGLAGYAKTLANEVAAEGITVNCLLPGYTLTDRLRRLVGAGPEAGPEDPVFAGMTREVPAGRVGLPPELAAAAAFLCSARASYITGTSLAVDGGWVKGLQ